MNLIEHRVRERAYFIWEGEGRVHGRADAHWLRAEAEIAAPAAAQAEILTVHAVSPEPSIAQSPVKVLKPKVTRTAKAAADVKPTVKPAPKATAKAPKAAASAALVKKANRASASAAALH